MENNRFINRVWWLKYPLLCLLIWPVYTTAANEREEITNQTATTNSITSHLEEEFMEVQQKGKNRTLTGVIVDDTDDSPIIGANVVIKGSKTGVITDAEGRFSIPINEKGGTLEISYIGYKKQTMYITDQGFVNIRMKSDNEMLNEVVIVGAGVQKKVSVTGAITSVQGQILKAPSSSLTNNIAGKLAGVISRTNSGEPGATSEFYIRGVGTFGGRTTPLILLDGVEISSADLDRLPAESIESFSLLKDASATAIYGARGANGVMLVTTKDGEINQRTKINVSVEASLQQPQKMLEYVDGATWMEMYNEAASARDVSPRYSPEDIEMTRSHKFPYRYPDVDWQKIMFKDATWNQRANINISGGGSKITYYMSLQTNHDTGMLDIPKTYSYDNNINRWNYIFQNNLTYKLTSTTKIGLKMNAQIGKLKGPNYSVSDLFYSAYEVNPIVFPATYPAQPDDTHIRFGNASLSGNSLYTNPYAKMLSSFKEENYNTLNTVMNIEQNLDFITKGLKVTALINFKNWSSTNYTRSIDPYYYQMKFDTWNQDNPNAYVLERLGTSGTDYITEKDNGYSSNNTFYFDARIDYNRSFEKHSVSGMLMYMQRENRSGVLPNRLQGLSGRFTYDYNHKYLAEFNFGYNGSERLKKGERFEFFPAMSLGWVVSGEDFWKPLENYVNYFKIRGSYGIVGSDDLDSGAGHFLYLNTVVLNGSGYKTGFDGEITLPGPGFSTLAVENACWERVNKLDIGVDLELFNQLNITFDYFYDRRSKILQKRGSWPIQAGYYGMAPWSNIGKVDNKGVEVSVNWRNEVAKDLFVDLRANLTYNKNKYIYYDEPNYDAVWRKKTGRPLSITEGYISEGLFLNQEEIDNWPDQTGLGSQVKPGDIKYRDVNGDGIITVDDQVMLSAYGGLPRIQYGLGLNMTYKGFDFGVFFNGSAKRTIMANGMTPFGEKNNNMLKIIADDYWSESNPNPNAAYPRLGLTKAHTDNNTQKSSFWMHNGNFIRFKTLELGYSFPHCRVYISGDNLAVWSPFKLWDPELNWNSYPMQRTFNFGVQLNF